MVTIFGSVAVGVMLVFLLAGAAVEVVRSRVRRVIGGHGRL